MIIGPQSSGKSTINKITCYCSWVEKKVSLDQSFDYFLKEDNFISNLVKFHKLDGYFYPNSEIVYTSPCLTFSFKNKKVSFEWLDQNGYIRTKISYIPAERNIVSIITDWEQAKLPENNIFNFMSDWNSARKKHTLKNTLSIGPLDTKYYYDENQNLDYLEMSNGKNIQLLNASSGQQSMIPLYILINYFTKEIYNKNEPYESVENKERDMEIAKMFFFKSFSEITKKKIDFNDKDTIKKEISQLLTIKEIKGKKDMPKKAKDFLTKVTDYLAHYIGTNYTSLFIEEPELNLFPSTQRDLLYFIINSINDKDHKLVLTTHSPYILYALNNCMMGWLVKDNMPESISRSLKSHNSWIDPKLVSAWQIKDGELISIQEQETNSIGKHYFNEAMNETMDEYYIMLNYLKFGKDEK